MRMYLSFPVVIALLLGATSCMRRNQLSQKDIWVKCDTVHVAIQRKLLQFPAQVVPAEEVRLAFNVSGNLERIFVEEGKNVQKGELIAQMNPRDYELQLQAVESEYRGIKADAERAFALYADSVIPMADYDKARYGLQQITAKYAHAKKQLADTRLYAPFDGVVKQCLFEPPTVVGAGIPIVTLLSSAMPEIRVYVPSSVCRQRDAVRAYTVKFDFLPTAIPLRVISVAPNANANQLYAIRLALPHTMPERPLAGMSAMVSLDFMETDESGVRIPSSAVFHRGESDYVWVLADGRVTGRKIEVASLHSDGTASILSGLSDGEIVVSAGVHDLTEGQSVKPLPATGKTNMGGLL